MKKSIVLSTLLFYFILPAHFQAAPARCTAVTGNWEDPGTWSCGRIPACGDTVVIPAGVIVTITSQMDLSACGSAIEIDVYGLLTFQNGKKLNLACGSQIFVQAGGSITSGGGGGTSNLINICGVDAWTTSDGPVVGPASVSSGGIGGLPVDLLYFTAMANHNVTTKLNWATATETNNKWFDVERSIDGLNFILLATINSKASGGNSLKQLEYQLIDGNPPIGTSYYRLKQVDRNGAFKLYSIISVNHSRKMTISIFPNPNSGEFTVDFSGIENNHEIEVMLNDESGKLVYTGSFYSDQSSNSVKIVPSEKMKSGAYFCTIILEGIKYVSKVIVK